MDTNSKAKPFFATFFVVLFLLLVPSAPPVAAQALRVGPDNTLLLAPVEVTAEAISVPFEIPYAGMIVVELYDEEGLRVFRRQQTRESGHHTFSFRPENFKAGKTYTYQLEYKGNVYSGEIARD